MLFLIAWSSNALSKQPVSHTRLTGLCFLTLCSHTMSSLVVCAEQGHSQGWMLLPKVMSSLPCSQPPCPPPRLCPLSCNKPRLSKTSLWRLLTDLCSKLLFSFLFPFSFVFFLPPSLPPFLLFSYVYVCMYVFMYVCMFETGSLHVVLAILELTM